jgi:hypothetical protein
VAEANGLEPPKSSIEDALHHGTSVVLSAIPVLGGPAGELVRWFWVPSLERRHRKWMEQVATVLRELEQFRSGFIQELQSNDAFVSFVTQATVVALRNHHEEKRTALHNALVNAAFSASPGDDTQLAFIRFIDELSPTHVVLLRLISEREEEVIKVTSYEDLYNLISPYLPTAPSRDLFKMLCLELQARGLLTISPDIYEFPGIYEESVLLTEENRDDLPRVRVSSVGHDFLSFIAEQPQSVA